jgi:superfamily II DNA helicase RecQ
LVDREDQLEKWVEEGGFIVATSALGTGVDYMGIVFVLHVGLPYGIIDYA